MTVRGVRGGLLGGAVLLVVLAVVGSTGDGAPDPVGGEDPVPATSPTSDDADEAGTTDEGDASSSPRGDDAPVVVQGRVVDVVDGDTIDLSDGTRVRLAITDTPEVFGGVEECGPEASDFTGAFLAGRTVAVLRPVGSPTTDTFGRTVGEVVRVVDGASLNVALVRAGLARIDERFTDEDPDLAGRLRSAAVGAARPVCEPQPRPTDPADETEGGSPAAAGGSMGHTGVVDGGWPCVDAYVECLPPVGDLDCVDIGHAVTLVGDDDPYRLDGEDGDGRGCETYPPWSPDVGYPYAE